MKQLKAGKSTHVIWNDFHRPYHDERAVGTAVELVAHIQPDYIHYNGDIMDFYSMSKFDQKPWKVADLQTDLDDTQAMFQYHATKFKKAKKYLHLGNHEDRMRRYLWARAKELSALRCLELGALMGLSIFDIKMVDYEEGMKINDSFVIQHGDIVSVHSSYTAKRLYEKHGGNGICGHTHRGGVYYKQDYEGIHGWWENFCLCSLHPDYIKNPNWQHGITVVEFASGKQFLVEQIPIIDGRCVYGGKVFGGAA